jgi:hypothetical protein
MPITLMRGNGSPAETDRSRSKYHEGNANEFGPFNSPRVPRAQRKAPVIHFSNLL